MKMKKLLFVTGYCIFLWMGVLAQQPKPKLLLLGSFHFYNPGLDVAKFENVDALSPNASRKAGKCLTS